MIAFSFPSNEATSRAYRAYCSSLPYNKNRPNSDSGYLLRSSVIEYNTTVTGNHFAHKVSQCFRNKGTNTPAAFSESDDHDAQARVFRKQWDEFAHSLLHALDLVLHGPCDVEDHRHACGRR